MIVVSSFCLLIKLGLIFEHSESNSLDRRKKMLFDKIVLNITNLRGICFICLGKGRFA